MLNVDNLHKQIEHSELIVTSLTIKDEMFSAYDLTVTAEVIRDNYPEGNLPYGDFHTELFRLSYRIAPPPSFKRTSWKRDNEEPVPSHSEVAIILDFALREFLSKRFDSELYDLTALTLPAARMIGPWWKKLWAHIRRK